MSPKYSNWRDYQEAAAAVFRDLRCNADVEKTVKGARGEHKIDVYVTFTKFAHECCWIVECKLWSKPVPREVVHTLCSKVQDIGADREVIFSESGFQEGARAAAQNTNILLQTSLEDFGRTARLHLDRIPLVPEEAEESDAPPVHRFPNHCRPHHLLKYEGRLFVANWGVPQVGNIAIVDPNSRAIEGVIDLDRYERRIRDSSRQAVLQHPPGNMAIADGKLFVGQVFSEFVLAIDIDTQSIVKRIPVPGGGEGAIAASPDGRHVYFASNRISRLFAIDSATYEFEMVDYPRGGRGCLCVLPHPSEPLLYLGIQRGGRPGSSSRPGSGCFLAVYDLAGRKYAGEIYLAEIEDNQTDSAMPFCLTYDGEQRCLFVGMLQSMRGICRVHELGTRILGDFRFEPNARNPHFRWVDPLSQALYRDKLLSVNRSNRELVTLDRRNGRSERTVYLGEAPNGPHSVAVFDDLAVVSYPEREGLIFLDLD